MLQMNLNRHGKALSSLVTVLLIMLNTACPGQTQETVRQIPDRSIIIDLSWSNPHVDSYVKNLPELEKACPADGLVIEFYGKKRLVDGKEFIPGSRTPWGRIPWRYEDFTEEITKLKSARSSKFTHNLFYTVPCPGDADWLSDKDWAAVANNYGLAARIARETGLKGILLDLEQYGKKFWIPPYNTDDTYEEICGIARRRGQEWGRAVFGAYPDILIFGLTMFSSHCATRVLRPFFNGIMDVMPPTATLIDGHETEGYKARRQEDYYRMMCDKYKHFVKYAEPGNRTKYYTQVKLAPAYYLDAIFSDGLRQDGWARRRGYSVPEKNGDRLEFFRKILHAGMLNCDGYLWFYGERGCWKKLRVPKFFTCWEELEPGVTRMVETLRCPENINVDKLVNIAGDNRFTDDSGKWHFWQIEEDAPKEKAVPIPGMGWAAAGSLNTRGTTHSCWHQSVAVKPGAMYLLRSQMRHRKGSHGVIWFSIGFINSRGNMLSSTDKSHSWEIFESTDGQWCEMNRLIIIPDDVRKVTLYLGAGGMRKKDTVSFRKTFFGEIPLR